MQEDCGGVSEVLRDSRVAVCDCREDSGDSMTGVACVNNCDVTGVSHVDDRVSRLEDGEANRYSLFMFVLRCSRVWTDADSPCVGVCCMQIVKLFPHT